MRPDDEPLHKHEIDLGSNRLLQGGWRAEYIGLSTVCLVARLRPPGYDEAAKSSLRMVLRALGQLAADHGAVTPVVGVVQADGAASQAVRRWVREQDWHRGDFSLYVEVNEEKADRRVRDLLAPTAPQWAATPKLRRLDDIREETLRAADATAAPWTRSVIEALIPREEDRPRLEYKEEKDSYWRARADDAERLIRAELGRRLDLKAGAR